MLDIDYIRNNPEKVKKAARDKNRKVDIDRLLVLDEKRREFIHEIEELRTERNKISHDFQASGNNRKKGRQIKIKIKSLEQELGKVQKEYDKLMLLVPNVPDDSVPVGEDESANKEIKKWGEIPELDFVPLDHIKLGRRLDLFDLKRGVKVSGFRGYFLKNEGAILEMAVLMYAFRKIANKGFIPMTAPSIVHEFVMTGSGQFPWGREDVYNLEKDNLFLAGTAEQPVTAFHADEILKETDLPKKYVAFSPCFRREAGSHGKDTRGLYRLHQFTKVEQVVISKNDYDNSLKILEELQENAEGLLKDLKLPYRAVYMSTGDMGEPQIKKYDLETWMPSRGGYGETMSNSFMGEFQARRLNIRYKTKKGKTMFVHTLNNTALASPRILIAILENYQQKDGSVLVPEVLREFIGKDKIEAK